LFRNQTVSLGIEKNGGRLSRRPKLTLSCSAEGKEGRKEWFLHVPHVLTLIISAAFCQQYMCFAKYHNKNSAYLKKVAFVKLSAG
jgi:hypothetical protein